MNDQSKMMNRGFGMWQQPPPQVNPSQTDTQNFPISNRPLFIATKNPNKPSRMNWKGKKAAEKRIELRRMEPSQIAIGSYEPPHIYDLQHQNRVKARRFYPKKKFNRFAPFAPRNTTSFIIRAKKAGGIASLVSPCPVTPAILPTPVFSPSREGLVDMAKEEWGVDGYGSMKGLIRLRSPGQEVRYDEEDEDGSSGSDVEEHVVMERRLDHDLSRFEMIYPNFSDEHANQLENRVDDQDTQISQLEEENLTLKERLFLMESELEELKRRLQLLETENRAREANREDGSENEGGGDVCSEKSVGD